MGVQEKILTYLSVYGKENKYRIASALKLDGLKVTEALSDLEKKGKIEMKGGRAILVKGKKPITTKARKQKKQPRVEAEEEQPEEKTQEEEKTEEEPEEEKPEEEQPKTEVSEELTEEKIEGTVKFYNPNKGFGFITGDDGEEYYVHESGLKKGITIEANNRVSFKVVQGDKGPKAEEVEWISQA